MQIAIGERLARLLRDHTDGPHAAAMSATIARMENELRTAYREREAASARAQHCVDLIDETMVALVHARRAAVTATGPRH